MQWAFELHEIRFGKQSGAPSDMMTTNNEIVCCCYSRRSIRLSGSSQNLRRVDIFQIQKGDPKKIGHYQNNSVVVNHTSLVSIPSDSLPRVHILLPLWLSIVLQIVVGGLMVFTAVLLVLYLCFRKEPEIKATSPYLSLLAFIGLFSLFIGTELHVLEVSLSKLSTPFCLSLMWFPRSWRFHYSFHCNSENGLCLLHIYLV